MELLRNKNTVGDEATWKPKYSNKLIQVDNPKEVTEVDFTSHTILTNDYWLIDSTSTAYYVWYQIDAEAVTDPAVGGKTGALVNIVTGDTATDIAVKTAAVIDALTGLSSAVPTTATIIVSNDNAGPVPDASDFNAGVVIDVSTQGFDMTITISGSLNEASWTSLGTLAAAGATLVVSDAWEFIKVEITAHTAGIVSVWANSQG